MNHALIGSIYACIAFLAGSLMSACVKWIGEDIPLLQIIFLRFMIGLLFIAPTLLKRSGDIFITDQWSLHLWRALLGLVALGCFYKAIMQMPFVNYATLHHLYPFFIVIISAYWLKEKIAYSQWIAVGLGFLGVVVITKPTFNVSVLPVILVLLGSLIAAVSDILVKELTKTEDSVKIVLYYFSISAILLSVVMPFIWVTPTHFNTYSAMTGVGISGVVLQYCLSQAYRFLQASTVGIWRYTEFLWALILGLSLWNETPTLHVWAGAILIFISSFVIQNIKKQD